MKRPLYYLLCAIACTPMIGTTMPMAAIAEAIQPQETAEQQAQADAMNSDTGKAEDGTNTNAAADTVEDGTATSTGTSTVNTESANGPAATPEAISTTSQDRLRPLRHRRPKRRHLHRLLERRPRGHRDDLPRNPDQRLVPGQCAHGRAHLLGRRRTGRRLRPVAPGMVQLLQPGHHGPRLYL